MPVSSVSSRLGAPECTISQFLHKRYCVTRIIRSHTTYQLLKVVDAIANDVKIVKVVSRTLIGDRKISGNIAWLRSKRTADGRHSVFMDDFKTSSLWYLVFKEPRATLRDILHGGKLSPLPPRHIRQISSQIISALISLHRQSILHLAIEPQHIEVTDQSTVTEHVYDSSGVFVERVILRRPEIALVFFGDAATSRDASRGDERYRAPEVVFGWVSKYRTDNFSVGCVFWEMLKGRPLFPPCPEGQYHVKAKAHMYRALLGDYPDDVRVRASQMNKGLFRPGSGELTSMRDVPENVKNVVRGLADVEGEIEDEGASEVFANLTMISVKERSPLRDILHFSYFERKD
ncbi:hypothetical protein CVT26_009843 [Gymnopilus dilepis]|uniref:Protein kinase domain-containing protein n=1 Tax=Gymnopilus dilepis TaxID=231916 RepID=A0A409WCQ1_9AGAR|nr:hypothetical protein CVT26_009843 [Gymnopilus dilepis]